MRLLSGNQAIARGAYEAGVALATGYPGTPSTEILESLSEYGGVYREWSTNEKVAFEAAAGAALAGARAITTMKHVGLNVAADPLMTLSYIGTVGGFAVCVADDPGMHSSQNEQDSRHFARFAKLPVLEPGDSQEAKDFTAAALALSEQYRVPVILRSTTRVSHSRSLVEFGPDPKNAPRGAFAKNPERFVPIPQWGRRMRVRAEERLAELAEAASASGLNRIEWRGRDFGIIACGLAYQYVREIFPEASVLKLGWSYPFPDRLIREFAAGVGELLVVEELEGFLEEHVKSIGIACRGKDLVPVIGELSADVLKSVRRKLNPAAEAPAANEARPADLDLPARPPVLCPGCPHRGVFYALRKFDVVVTGDIGCYSLGVFAPLERIDTILCMGGGVSMAHGMEKAGEPRRVVGVVGDSTFFHSGITGLLDIAYNRGKSVIVVLDNATTAMTGHQDHPGTGRTLMGESAPVVSIEAIGRACGIRNIATLNPYELAETGRIFKQALASEEAWLIVARAVCPLAGRKKVGPTREIDRQVCTGCGLCLRLGCPAIEKTDGEFAINALQCAGCGLCAQICSSRAIRSTGGTV